MPVLRAFSRRCTSSSVLALAMAALMAVRLSGVGPFLGAASSAADSTPAHPHQLKLRAHFIACILAAHPWERAAAANRPPVSQLAASTILSLFMAFHDEISAPELINDDDKFNARTTGIANSGTSSIAFHSVASLRLLRQLAPGSHAAQGLPGSGSLKWHVIHP